MTDFTGIFTTNNQAPLIFLDIGDQRTGELLPSLQAFESSLLMIGMGRWTNAVIHICSAVELITREKFQEKSDLVDQINSFCSLYRLSGAIKSAAHETRKKRNEFVHKSTIPKDNDDAILTYLTMSLSAYKIFLESEFGLDLYELINSDILTKNLKIVRDLAKKSDDRTTPIEERLLGYKMSVLVKTIANFTHEIFTPQAMYYAPDQNNSWDAWDNYTYLQSVYEECCDGEVMHHQNDTEYAVICPAGCGSFLSLEVSTDDEESLLNDVFGSAKCCNCGLFISTKELLKIYVKDTLGEEKIANLLKSYGLSKSAST